MKEFTKFFGLIVIIGCLFAGFLLYDDSEEFNFGYTHHVLGVESFYDVTYTYSKFATDSEHLKTKFLFIDQINENMGKDTIDLEICSDGLISYCITGKAIKTNNN